MVKMINLNVYILGNELRKFLLLVNSTDIYAGTKPASEPETKAVKDFILSKSPYWLSFITIHSYGGLWLHHWENRTELTKKSFIRIVITIITVFWVTVILIALYLSVTNQ